MTITMDDICVRVGFVELGSRRLFLTCNPPRGKITHIQNKNANRNMTKTTPCVRHSKDPILNLMIEEGTKEG